MEKHNLQRLQHKNVLKKEEEIFLMFSLFLIAGIFIYMGFSIDSSKNFPLQAFTTFSRQFSIVENVYAGKNH